MPNKKTPKPKPLYRRKLPVSEPHAKAQRRGENSIFHEIPESHFTLNEDGEIQSASTLQPSNASTPQLLFSHDSPFLRLYHADCLSLLDAIAAKYPHGRFDAIFADPPYFLSNGGITCHAGRMVKVDKGDWDKSRGPELNHEFNREWLARCQKVLKPHGALWVSGTHHVIFSIGYAMQQLGYKILNDIAWEKPNPPPNLSCRYFAEGSWFFITINCQPREKNQLCQPDMGRQVLGAAIHNHEKFTWHCRLCLLMPDHLHAIISFPREPGMKTVVSNWKKFLSLNFGIKWQRDFFDHRLRDEQQLQEKTSYILMNPVRKGLCERPDDWPWILPRQIYFNGHDIRKANCQCCRKRRKIYSVTRVVVEMPSQIASQLEKPETR